MITTMTSTMDRMCDKTQIKTMSQIQMVEVVQTLRGRLLANSYRSCTPLPGLHVRLLM